MATYPKQLQLPTPSKSGLRVCSDWADKGAFSDGFTPPADETVNDVLHQLAGVIDNWLPGDTERRRRRFQPFDTSFGDVVIYPASVAITGGKTVTECINDLRSAWDTYALRGDRQTGLASSVDS